MLSEGRVELDTRFVAFDLFNGGARDGEDVAVRVPLDVLDQHAGVDKDRRIIGHVPHELHATALVGDAKCRCLFILILIAEALTVLVIPLDGSKGHLLAREPAQAVDPDRELEVSNVVVNVNGTLWSTEEDRATVRRPLDDFESDLELLTPKARSFDRADDDSAIFVNDADLLTVWSPAHIRDDTLVPVVDHLLEPMRLVEHPYNDETLLVTGGQLLVLVVPLKDHDVALVALQVLVHGQVAASLAFA